MTAAAPRVCLSISSFRNDEAVTALLERAMALENPPFEKILVVDSMGTGNIPHLIVTRGWEDVVQYRSFDRNLGSAGNLAERLKIPAEQGFDYVYAINHDGLVDAEVIGRLVEFAQKVQRPGAVYPLRRFPNYDGKYDVTGQSRGLFGALRKQDVPAVEALRVFWSSSNGALYATTPVREGLQPWSDFWMGWEDLAYGWLLEENGYEQYVLTAAQIDDNYEYQKRGIGPFQVTMSEKPAWYAYYGVRNLVLTMRRLHLPVQTRLTMLARLGMEVPVTTLLRSSRWKRLKLVAKGMKDGVLGLAGKGPVP